VTDDLTERQARDTAALARALMYTVPLPCSWGDDAWHRAVSRLTRLPLMDAEFRRLLAEERGKTGGEQP
jgi:hypothetical protein